MEVPGMKGARFPSASVIIPNYNGREFLRTCLESLTRIVYPTDRFEVILVDNASTDGSAEYTRTSFPSVKVLELDRNYGFTAVNKGVDAASGEFVVLLNNDTEVDSLWLDELVTAAHKLGFNHVFASKTVRMDDPTRIDYHGGKVPINGRGYSTHLGERDPHATELRVTGYPCAASMLVKREVFLELGGFDGDYFACHDDVDFGIRAWLLGHQVFLVPTSVVSHHVSGTVGGRSTYFSIYHHAKNALQNVLKNFEIANVVKVLMVGTLFDLGQLALLLVEGNHEGVRALFDAYLWVLRNLDAIVSKRKTVQACRVFPDRVFREGGLRASLRESLHVYGRLRG